MRDTSTKREARPAGMETADRIRDAAIARFGRDGFAVGLRALATEAGVTAGLIVHHFGSKDGLRHACDEHVLAVIRAEKTKAVTTGTAAMLFAQLAEVEQFAPMARYLLRSLQAGGTLAAELVEHMMADAQEYLAAGEAAGVILPSRDPAARTRYLAYQNIGGLLLWATMHLDDHPDDFAAAFRRYSQEITLPALELFSQGLFVDRSMLDDYLMYVPDPPTAGDADSTAS
ncbi:TetR/AcrR family transcriptional regulator [Jiangella mangrovi]|uniref:AcrR family transcriptional regulator n=1 Tax=Jiangella mangrovi TaxID=1524084 RepID=A0A7W9GUP2_9ACTN|nr:TetR family transcriptional regulator [Jiangella mangrovi]MBB5790370.1 AcrR family transcriptional regulator [Jiangella mangrovi]